MELLVVNIDFREGEQHLEKLCELQFVYLSPIKVLGLILLLLLGHQKLIVALEQTLEVVPNHLELALINQCYHLLAYLTLLFV